MPKIDYKLNPQMVMSEPFRQRAYRIMRRLLIWFIVASVANFIFSWFFYTPKMYFIERDNREMTMKYEILRARIDAATRQLGEIKHRDQTVYRPLFGQDTLAVAGIYTPYPEAKYAHLAQDRVYSPLTTSTWLNLDALGRMIYLESVSMDQLQSLSLDKERLAMSVPAIWPIDRTRWANKWSLFGMRRHPILGYVRMHSGLDLTAPRGTEVYATANGKVVESEWRGGYGRQIVIDHGFGYKTRYAHLNESYVVPGQVVTRGEVIGEVGSTGLSQAPHIHYEVLYMNQQRNPLAYFSLDMNAGELDRIIESAREERLDLMEEN